jgi:antitoxin (DNA-binding transcriptional repressor) of toxin-antitoxin stability system
MSTIVDQARSHVNAWESPKPVHHTMWANDAADLLRQLADRVQELEGKGEPVARVVPFGATMKLEWASVEAAHNAKPGQLYASPPSSVQPEKEERRPLSDEQRRDLLAAALYIASENDKDATLTSESATRIVDTLYEVGQLDELVAPSTVVRKS